MIEPIPVEDGIAATCCVIFEKGVWRLAWLQGRRKTPFGEPYQQVRDAAQACRDQNESIFGAYK